ncbi:hypothetical protein OEZ60_03710 [Defluviimonas sp. WL0024]|uniref:MOSC domain-containing protein n=2 Tax=Albidovulum TaxID=205889 RepID=A0ABT3IZP5_9RHOB|nr:MULTISPECIES: hypothetical protein [Defluviimonas]MCU9847103.1 hypothetical protein [Defluviimonas sp. WL0024]MCW3780903.1 hypothetical protein [Defluviimonas salinarum]
MTRPAPVVTPLPMEELRQALPQILAAPKDEGEVKAIVIRPAPGERRMVDQAELSLAGGVHGDHWAKGCWMSTEDGQPHPDVQICMMNARCIEAIAGEPENWAPAGDNLFIDMDLSPANLPPGTRLALGTVELVTTDKLHAGCQDFIDRYGRDACLFVNTGEGKTHRLRGIYARVTKDGTVKRGDRMRKIG